MGERHQHIEFYAKCKENLCDRAGNEINQVDWQMAVHGITGELKFDVEGRRSNIVTQILELNAHGLSPIGTWNPNDGIAISRQPSENFIDSENSSLRNRTFIVLTVLVLNQTLSVLCEKSISK